MSQQNKVSEAELNALRNLQVQFDEVTKRYGELTFQKILVKKELAELKGAMESLDAERQRMVAELQTKFGASGTVKIETGEFIPD